MKMQKYVIFLKKNVKINTWQIKNIVKLEILAIYTWQYRVASHKICNLKDSVPKKIPIASHSRSSYYYHFIIKQFVEEFKKQFICLGKNSEKYITFTVSIENEVTRIDKNGEEIKIKKIYLT